MNKHYIENKKKHATTCIITDHPTVTEKLMSKGAIIAGVMSYSKPYRTDASSFVGVAKCHKLDTPDATKGHHVASSKADLAYHKAMYKDLMDTKTMLLEELAIVEALGNHETKMIDKTQKLIESFKK
jgi:hypothetical protein